MDSTTTSDDNCEAGRDAMRCETMRYDAIRCVAMVMNGDDNESRNNQSSRVAGFLGGDLRIGIRV